MSEPMFGGQFADVDVQLSGNDGNAFAIMGSVVRALKANGATEDQIAEYHEASMSGDYDNLLSVACRTVNVL
tara:strand:+ start:348 stop:563 length:216 start_codon:yes stop_codon:yes gene_type:complete